MPNSVFPKNPVQVRDVLSELSLPANRDMFAHFKFHEFGPECSRIVRVVFGTNRDAVKKYHDDHPNIAAQPTFSGTSDFGFGPVVVVADDGSFREHEDRLIFIGEKGPDPDAQGMFAARQVSIANVIDDLPSAEQTKAEEAQATCSANVTDADRASLRARAWRKKP